MEKIFTISKGKGNKGRIVCEGYSTLGTQYKGVATCSPSDEFSVEKGMRIAELRAEVKQLQKILNSQLVKAHEAYAVYWGIARKNSKLIAQIGKRSRELSNLIN